VIRIEAHWVRCGIALVLFAMVLSVASCNKPEKATESVAQAQKTFASPDEAGKALIDALRSDNRDALLTIFGPQSKDLVYSGDATEDKASFAGFVLDYDVMHRWRKLDDGNELLITGADNKAFPIPLTKSANRQWKFDTSAGKQEILSRRIGRNEIAAIDVCSAITTAEMEYFAQKHGGSQQFAHKFISDEGKQDGLYWPQVEGQARSPLGPLVAYATAEGFKAKPDSHEPFHGYYFRMLDKQGADAKGGAKDYINHGKMTGGFAVVAYPAKYGDSGIMTFIVNQNGTIYQKNLGQNTEDVGSAMTEFNPDKTWMPIDE